ncbi:hypothetical protein D3C81_1529220 [compost metagenome]
MRKKQKKPVMPWRDGILDHHKREKRLRGSITRVTPNVRSEVNRRSMELLGADIPVCERCGSPHNLSKAHIKEASHLGPGYDPANIMNLCGTHGMKGTCHDWADNTMEGRAYKKQYGAMLRLYYSEGNGKNYWSYKEEA